MDVDAFVLTHRAEWDRLDQLVRRSGRLSGAEADELVALYQRAATHLSVVRSEAPDPQLVARLSSLVARARAAVTGAPASPAQEVVAFLGERFPAAVYRARWWAIGAAAAFLVVAVAMAVWVARSPDVQAAIATPAEVKQLVEQDFEDYYSSAPAASFAARVWTNNAWIAALCIASGGLLGLPVLWIIWQNASNVGVTAGLMAANDRLGLFFGLVTPHGLLELTAVFVAAGVGLRLGWTVIDPGRRPRGQALAEEGRAAAGIALGLVLVLLASGLIEAFVTPSGLPTWARIGIGVAALLAFLAWIGVYGRRAALAGEVGDVDASVAGDRAPAAA